jgi:hypothetical protein
MWSIDSMFTSDVHLAKPVQPVQPVSGLPLVTMAVVVVTTCLLGVGCLLSSFWQDAGQWPVSPPTVGTSGELLGSAFASLIGLLAPMALGCVVLLQNQQLRFERQHLAHVRYQFAIETALRHRRTVAPDPPVATPAQRIAPRLQRAACAVNEPNFLPEPTLVTGLTQQPAHYKRLTAIRALDAAITVCEVRLTHGAGKTEALELQQLISRLHRRLQQLEHNAARDLAGPDHE